MSLNHFLEIIPEIIVGIPEMIPEMMHPFVLVIRFASRVVVVGFLLFGGFTVFPSPSTQPVVASRTTAAFK